TVTVLPAVIRMTTRQTVHGAGNTTKTVKSKPRATSLKANCRTTPNSQNLRAVNQELDLDRMQAAVKHQNRKNPHQKTPEPMAPVRDQALKVNQELDLNQTLKRLTKNNIVQIPNHMRLGIF